MKRWLKRTALAVGTYLILQTLWLVAQREWRRAEGEREFAAATAETAQTDPDWQWDALNAKRTIPPPESNGAALVPRVRALLPAEWVRPVNPKVWEPDVPAADANQAFPVQAIAAVRREFADAHDAVVLARSFRDFSAGNRLLQLAPNPWDTKLQDTQDTRTVSRLLHWDAVLAVEEGDRERAADDLHAMLNVSRSIGDEPFLISQLVRIATRITAARSLEWVIGQTELTESRLAALQAAWAADADEPLFLYGARGERAVIDVMLRNMIDGTIWPEAVTDGSAGSFEKYSLWLFRAKLWKDRVYLHRYLSRAVEIARLPIHEQPHAVKDLPELPGSDLKIAQLLVPAVEKVASSYLRSVAEARCVVVALACERFRLARGRWPNDLAELPKELLAAVPLDPFDGKPLRYRTLPDGVVIYSVGKNGADDGGEISRASGRTSADEGIRLWNPTARRQTAENVAPPPRPVEAAKP